MTITEICYEHIAIDEHGVPYIAGTTMNVVELISEKLAYGWSPEEFLFQHPYLTLGQIHAALAYYWDRVEELEKDIANRQAKVKELQKQAPVPPLITRLRAQRVI